MRRRRCTGQNSVSKHPTGSPAHGCTYKKSPNLKSIVGIRYDSVMLHLISLQFLGAPSKKKHILLSPAEAEELPSDEQKVDLGAKPRELL